MTALTPNIKSKRKQPYRAIDDLTLLESDFDELDPRVIPLIDALARAQAADDHRRETETTAGTA